MIGPIHDHHTHVTLYASLGDAPRLDDLEEPTASQLLASQPRDRLSLVLGWSNAVLPLDGDLLASLPPLVIVNQSLHGFRLTRLAQEALMRDEGELVERHGDPQWCERNLPRLLRFFAAQAPLTASKLETFMSELQALGIQSTEDLLMTSPEAMSVLLASPWANRIRLWTDPHLFKELPDSDQAKICGLKLFLDGALGTRTAAMSQPYLDGSRGLLVYSDSNLLEYLTSLHGLALPLALHAIGDLAIQQALRVLETLHQEGLSFPYVRLEHVQFITQLQARRARDLGLILSMQPNFNADSRNYLDRLPIQVLEANNPFRMLIDDWGFQPGRNLIFGSDGMPHGLNAARIWFHPNQALREEELQAGYAVA